MPQDPLCKRCSLYKTTSKVCIWGSGPEHADIMVVGEAPGAEEEQEGQPFVGNSGKLLNSLLQQAGLNRSTIRSTNVVRCRPPNNQTPTQPEQQACLPFLLEEIQQTEPKVVVALGSTAISVFTGKAKVIDARGHLLSPRSAIRLGDAKLLGTYHPAAILHRGNDKTMTEAIVQDLALAKRTANPPIETEHKRTLLFPPYSLDDLKQALRPLLKAKVVAVDCEWTGGTDNRMRWPWTKGAELYSVSITGRIEGAKTSIGIAWPPPEGGLNLLSAFFTRVPAVFHNAMADLLWLSAMGIIVRLAGDTMILAQLLDEARRLSLESLATTVAGVPIGWKQPPRLTRPTTEYEWIKLLQHNTDDTDATLLLAEALHRQVQEKDETERNNILRLYRQLCLPSVNTFVKIAHRGVPVDPNKLQETIEHANATMRSYGATLSELTHLSIDDAMLTATSSDKTLVLLRKHGLTIETSRKEELSEFADHPLVGPIQGIRHEKKFLGTYLLPWRELTTEQGDDRLHTIYRMTGTRTGRTSAETEKGGNLQLTPREARMRRLIKPRNGRVIISADFSQAELRVAAWFAKEQTMLQLYQEGADLHTATAAFIIAYGRDHLSVKEFWPRRNEYIALVDKELRQRAKGANFGLIYGMGAEKFVLYAWQNYRVRLTLEEAQQIHTGYFMLYSDLLNWHKECENQFYKYGYTLTPFGRYRRHLDDSRKAINTPVQATASDLGQLAMNEIDQRLTTSYPNAWLIGFVHDSVLVESPEDEANDIALIVKDCMEHPPVERFGFSLPIPLITDVKIGLSWAEAA